LGGLGLSVMAACSAALVGDEGWLAWRVLGAGWALTGLALSALASREGLTFWMNRAHEGLVALVALLLLGLALRSAGDPAHPWWSAGLVVWAGGLLAGLALFHREAWAFLAGLCMNLAVTLFVRHAHPGPLEET